MRKGDTFIFETPPSFLSFASVGGKKEAEGPLKDEFDLLLTDTLCGESCWETAETMFSEEAIKLALKKSGFKAEDIDAFIGGDLQAQCTATAYAMRDFDSPFIGVYGACSTMAESIGISAMFVAGGFMGKTLALASSHFCSAERQYRTPLNYGGKRTPTAQWTVTGCGATVIAANSSAPYIKSVAFGRVRDFEISDITNMGAAMAPAAAQTILKYFEDTGESPDSFDAIYTGDLGLVGSTLLLQILEQNGLTLNNHKDCGLIIYSREEQNVQAGASGAGCSATVLCAHILPRIKSGELKRVLFLSTGALMSQTTFLQGESIPCIAHLVEISHER